MKSKIRNDGVAALDIARKKRVNVGTEKLQKFQQ